MESNVIVDTSLAFSRIEYALRHLTALHSDAKFSVLKKFKGSESCWLSYGFKYFCFGLEVFSSMLR